MAGVALKPGKKPPIRDANNGTAQCGDAAISKASTQIAPITLMMAKDFRRYYANRAAEAIKDNKCSFSLNASVSVGSSDVKVPTPLPPEVQTFAEKPWLEFVATYLKAADLCDGYHEPIPNTDGVGGRRCGVGIKHPGGQSHVTQRGAGVAGDVCQCAQRRLRTQQIAHASAHG